MKHNMFAPFYRNGMLQIILFMRLIDTYFVEKFLIGIRFAYFYHLYRCHLIEIMPTISVKLVLYIVVDDLETKV